MAQDNVGFVASVYIGREDARGPSLDIGNTLNLKEQRGMALQERVVEASKKIRKGDPRDEFTSTWSKINDIKDELGYYRLSAQNIPHFDTLNMNMLAAAWEIYLSVRAENEEILTPKILHSITRSQRGRGESLFITDLRKYLVSKPKGQIVSESDLDASKIEWDLIRYTQILLRFKPDEII